MNQCLENLRRIDSAKRQWAFWTILQPDSPPGTWFEIIETNPIANRIPTPKEIASSLSGDNQMPHCPSGGTYTMGRVLDPPTCSVHDHDILRGPIGFEVQEGWTRFAGATVVLTDDSGKHWTNVSNTRGGTPFNTWPNKAVSVVISKEGFVTVSGKVPLPNGVADNEIVTLHKK